MYALIDRGERVLGALQLSWCDTPTPSFPPRELVDVARTYVALAVDMHARTDETGQTASILSETAMLLASIHDPDVLLETMARRIADAIGCDVGAVFLVDDNTRLFRFAAGVGPAEALATVRATEGDPARFARLLAACEDDVLELSGHPRRRPAGEPHRRGRRLRARGPAPSRRGARRRARTRTHEPDGPVCPPSGGACEGARAPRRRCARDRAPRSLARRGEPREERLRRRRVARPADAHPHPGGLCRHAARRAAGPLVEEQRKLVDSIRERSLQFRDLVDGILAVARLDAQRGHSLAAPVRLDQLCMAMLRELDDRRAPGVGLRYRARPVTIEVDAPKVRMILRNLVSNALKFTTTGEVVVSAEVADRTLVLRVTDTGPGIDPADRSVIFEMFHQGSAARRAGGSGLGLGLYLVRRLSHVLGGTARLVQADPGRTCFEVSLPMPGEPPPGRA